MKIRGFNEALNKWVYVEIEHGKAFEKPAEWYDINPTSVWVRTGRFDINMQECPEWLAN